MTSIERQWGFVAILPVIDGHQLDSGWILSYPTDHGSEFAATGKALLLLNQTLCPRRADNGSCQMYGD